MDNRSEVKVKHCQGGRVCICTYIVHERNLIGHQVRGHQTADLPCASKPVPDNPNDWSPGA